jgi:DNA replication ATP-dependent helicase Dna2
MSSFRPAVGALARAASRATPSSVRQTAARQQQQLFSTSRPVNASHGSQYDPPTGWLFGVKPGEKYKPEGWENLFFYGFCGSLGVFAVVYAFKPDTSYVYSRSSNRGLFPAVEDRCGGDMQPPQFGMTHKSMRAV